MIDWRRVRELQSEIGEENMVEVIDLFMSEVEAGLETAMASTTAQQHEEALHFLKGCALNIGFDDFAKLCRDWEAQAAKGGTEGIDPHQLKALFAASREAFDQGYATEIAA